MSVVTLRRRALWIACLLLGLCVALGTFVRKPLGIDVSLENLCFGNVPQVAQIYTTLGLLPTLIEIGIALLVFGGIVPQWRRRVLFSIGALIVTHFANDAAKSYFERHRPGHWLMFHETSYAYPSGHAATAIAFYLLWAVWIARDARLAPLLRWSLTVFLCIIVAGVLWSRLALGAHWPTDLVGGALLGAGVVAMGIAISGNPEMRYRS